MEKSLRVVAQSADLDFPGRSCEILRQVSHPRFTDGELVVIVVIGDGIQRCQSIWIRCRSRLGSSRVPLCPRFGAQAESIPPAVTSPANFMNSLRDR